MKHSILTGSALALAIATTASAQPAPTAKPAPDYVAIVQEVAVNKPAAEVWKKVGGYCDIQKWLPGAKCEYTSGSGGLGTNRLIVGKINEVMVSQTELSYGYAQPLVPNMYHGQVEARPVTPATSKLIYSLVYDASTLADQAAKDAYKARLSAQFMAALKTMKTQAEAQ